MNTQTAHTAYSADRDAAIKASGTARIYQKGAYAGEFTRAEVTVSSVGTVGIDLSFKAVDGSTADYLTIWTHNKAGEELSGYGLVAALLSCMRVKNVEAKRARIEKYNHDAGARMMMDADIYPDMMGKPIGLLLVQEEYLSHGIKKTKLVITGCYEPATGKTAAEIWKKLPATSLPALTASLRDKPLREDPGNPPATRAQGPITAGFDDSIPF